MAIIAIVLHLWGVGLHGRQLLWVLRLTKIRLPRRVEVRILIKVFDILPSAIVGPRGIRSRVRRHSDTGLKLIRILHGRRWDHARAAEKLGLLAVALSKVERLAVVRGVCRRAGWRSVRVQRGVEGVLARIQARRCLGGKRAVRVCKVVVGRRLRIARCCGRADARCVE